jgi:hypothetical protein
VDWLTLRVLVNHSHYEILIGVESAELVDSKIFLVLFMP